MSAMDDRLYNLLPVVYRQRDAEQGYPLQQLLRVIAEQVDVVENNILQLYENWFIETCEDWVVPYIADLIGFRAVETVDGAKTASNALLNSIRTPRREVANSIGYRRRKGTLALLEQLTSAVAGWPSRVVECGRHVSASESINHMHLKRGQTLDLRTVDALDLLGTPFDRSSRTVEVRGVNSPYARGTYNLPDVAVFLWRLPVYSITRSPALCLQEAGDHCYTFSILGNDVPLYNLPTIDPRPTEIAKESNLPSPIRRRAFAEQTGKYAEALWQGSHPYYGENRSLAIWAGKWAGGDPTQPVPAEKIISADLRGWEYRPKPGYLAVDPELGRMAFPPTQLPDDGVTVSYHYAFSTNIGGGEYQRTTLIPANSSIYRVGPGTDFPTLREAYEKWLQEAPLNAVIEITDSGVYEEQVHLEVGEKQSLELRAANGTRPVIYLVNWQTSRPDALMVTGARGSSFTLDGILVTGKGVEIRGKLNELTIRHSTLVPGWGLDSGCKPRRPMEPSLSLFDMTADVRIEHSILGPVQVIREDLLLGPLAMHISDSIMDANGADLQALGAPGRPVAPVELTVRKCTVFGRVHAHSIELAENSIFSGRVLVARRQTGCMRFCYVAPQSRTPKRYQCQPELVEKAIEEKAWREQL
jgi:hypothetical protein